MAPEPDCVGIVAVSSSADLLRKVYPHEKGRAVDLGFNRDTKTCCVVGPTYAVSEILSSVGGKVSSANKEDTLNGMRWILYRTQ